ARALCDRSWLLAERGDLAGAIASCEVSLALARAEYVADPTALVLHNLACFSRMRGDLAGAHAYAAEALALARAQGWEWLVTMILVGLGYTVLDLGDVERAITLHQEALALGVARGDLVDMNTALEGLATSALAAVQREPAARLFGVASALRDAIAMPMSPTEQAYFQPLLDTLRVELGAERFTRSWTAGRLQPRASAITEALGFRLPAAAVEPAVPRLTPREHDVLQQLATGKSTRAVSEALFISPATVATHVASLYRKLGVRSRAEAVAWSHRHGLG
ncbi:MAG: helix-turn-helix transcriptional regulator, partial [Thermomicrobiales bacterium]|nr:helix-turn-helix transcriptional regulator [Thermomicrobiales bacterium]